MPYVRIHCNLCGQPAQKLGHNVAMMKIVDELNETLQVCFDCIRKYMADVEAEYQKVQKSYGVEEVGCSSGPLQEQSNPTPSPCCGGGLGSSNLGNTPNGGGASGKCSSGPKLDKAFKAH